MSVPSPCLNSSDIESFSLSASKTSSVTSPSESRTRTRSSAASPTATSSTRAQKRVSIRPGAAEMQLANIPEDAKPYPREQKIEAKSRGLRSYPSCVLLLCRVVSSSLFPHDQSLVGHSFMRSPRRASVLSTITGTFIGIRRQTHVLTAISPFHFWDQFPSIESVSLRCC